MSRQAAPTRKNQSSKLNKPKPQLKIKPRQTQKHPKKALIKKQIRQTRPIHKKIFLHPISILVLLCIGVLLCFLTWQTVASTIFVSATIPAAPLTVGAEINYPTDNEYFTETPINLSGICEVNSYIKLYDNGLFSGVAWCSSMDSFVIQTDLYSGENTLVAQDYNVTNQEGPVTPAITVNYVPSVSSGSSSNSTSGSQTTSTSVTTQNSTTPVMPVVLTSDFQYQTFVTQQAFTWQVSVSGGQPPYTVLINWGDGTTSTQYYNTDPLINLKHVYKKAGYYAIKVTTSDSTGRSRLLQLAALIKLPNSTGILTKTSTASTNNKPVPEITSPLYNNFKYLLLIWPAFIIIALMVLSFWLGEREKYQMIVTKKKKFAHR